MWRRLTFQISPSRQVATNVHHYIELATGLNYWSNSQWMPSREEIDILPGGGAAATTGQHQAYFPNDIYQGEIQLVTPDGKQLQSRPLGLSFDDGTNTVLIAGLTNSAGFLVGSNQVIYPNAFDNLTADVRYTYTKGAFEQDIVLRSQLPTPESLGLDPSARLQVLTEFFNPPQPTATTTLLPNQAGIALSDEALDFGVMKMGMGRAFLMGDETNSSVGNAVVGKQWVQMGGRWILVEEVPVAALADKLATLPVPQVTSVKMGTKAVRPVASGKLPLPPQHLAKAGDTGQPMRMTKASGLSRGLVLDYQLLNSGQTDFTFQQDTTYYISGTVNLDGTSTFEGGAVLKYAANSSINLLSTNLNWQASAYRPVIFTAIDDNSVGESLGSGNPSGYYANPALSFQFGYWYGSLTLSNFHVAYARQALFTCYGNYTFYDCQFVNCLYGVYIQSSGNNLYNALFSGVMTNICCTTEGGANLQNVTVDSSAVLSAMTGEVSVLMANCIFANVTNLGSSFGGNSNGFYRCPMFGTGVSNTFYPFQTIGAGNYYLANGCNFTNHGTTNIDSILLADLGRKTTHPPVAFLGTNISTDTSWSVQVPRDTNAAPDLGYHYDPLDYLVSNVTVQATLTLTNGVAVGAYGANGLTVTGSWISRGTAVNWIRLIPCSLVQEQPSANATPAALINNNGSWTNISFRFTDLAMPGGAGYLLSVTDQGTSGVQGGTVTIQDCGLHGGLMTFSLGLASTGTSSGTLNMTNNLLERCQVTLSKYDSIPSAFYVNQYNNLYHGGVLNIFSDISQDSNTLWRFYDNLFEGVTVNEFGNDSGNPPYWSVITNGYNGYVNSTVWYGGGFFTSPTLLNSVGGDEFPSVADYQTDPMGSYYYPTNGGNLSLLIHVGSRSAASAGLYHYTVTTDQTVEGTNTVSIGYHYVAVGQYGNPLDSNGDGIPDYLEDANGNGLDDSGETPWDLAISAQPQSQNAVQGVDVTFAVVAAGVGPFNYQWRFNGTNIPAASGSSYTRHVVLPSDAGNYSVVVWNAGASVPSSNAILTVTVPLAITAAPTNQSVLQGTNVNFSVGVSGTAPGYQWVFNGTALTNTARIAGSTGSSLVISNVQPADAGNYWAVASNAAGSVTSPNAVLTVMVPPVITNAPQSLTNVQGSSATFSVGVSGTAPLSYQWYFNGTNVISGAIGGSYTKWVVTTNNAGNYSVVVANAAGSVTSAPPATLTVIVPPWITQQPANQTVLQGSNATFNVLATGTANLYYQWFSNATNLLPGATNNLLTVTSVLPGQSGNYYSVVVSNAAGAITSSNATLTVVVPPLIAGPTNQTVVQGSNATFNVTATSGNLLNYQWYLNSNGIAGAVTSLYTRYVVRTSDMGYYMVAVTNLAGNVSSNAYLTVVLPPSIAIGGQPQSTSVLQGANATFSVTATGTTPLGYQWFFNGTNSITGATSASLTRTNVQATNAGNYSVTVTNLAGTAVSASAVLTVMVPPVITNAPQSLTNVQGSSATFSVGASGTAPLSYQWYFKGTNIAGATSSNYTKLVVQTTDAGSYSVVVTNVAGRVTNSPPATLTVTVPPLITAQPTNLTVNLTSNATFSVGASGTAPLGYQWLWNGNVITGATANILTVNNVQAANVGYYSVVVTNAAGTNISQQASLTVTMLSAGLTNTSAMKLNGNAVYTNTSDGRVLELTRSITNQAGSAFFLTPISLVSNASFSTFFFIQVVQRWRQYGR